MKSEQCQHETSVAWLLQPVQCVASCIAITLLCDCQNAGDLPVSHSIAVEKAGRAVSIKVDTTGTFKSKLDLSDNCHPISKTLRSLHNHLSANQCVVQRQQLPHGGLYILLFNQRLSNQNSTTANIL